MRNYSKLFIFCLALVFCMHLTSAFAEDENVKKSTKPTIRFSIADSFIGMWSADSNFVTNDPGETNKSFEKIKKIPALVINLDLSNKTKIKKFKLDKTYEFFLQDEYGNEYRQITTPFDYDFPIYYPNTHYPSLYPGESYRMTIFFEPPIRSSKILTLLVKEVASDVTGTMSPVSVFLPTLKIKNIKTIRQEVKHTPTYDDLSFYVINPREKYNPGDIVKVRVHFSKNILKPDRVFIITANHNLEDKDQIYKYDIRIPEKTQSGEFSIVVLARI